MRRRRSARSSPLLRAEGRGELGLKSAEVAQEEFRAKAQRGKVYAKGYILFLGFCFAGGCEELGRAECFGFALCKGICCKYD